MPLLVRQRTLIMGVLNATEDSFAGDGLAGDLEALVARGLRMALDGADILDVGAASTRPGHTEVPLEVERARASRAVAALAERVAIPLSVDTVRPEVAEACLVRGATIVNDVSGLVDERTGALAARFGATLVLAHSRRSERSRAERDAAPELVVAEVWRALADACTRAERLGCPRERIFVDPGLGFAKTTGESFALLRELRGLRDIAPILVGPSRKGHLGTVTGRTVEHRSFATAGAVAAAVLGGADAVRVHDVAEMVDVVRVADAIRRPATVMPPPRIAFIGLGANLGDRRVTLRRAVEGLAGIGEVLTVSQLWETAPQLVTDQPAFLNAVAAVRVAPGPAGVLVERLGELERRLGRTAGERYGPRVVDLDLLLFAGQSAIEIDGPVTVPHPRLAERRFGLAPLAELAPDERDPRTGLPVRSLLAAVGDQPAAVVEGGAWWRTS